MRTLFIPIDDDNSVCSQGYQVQYKKASEVQYTDWFPNQISSPIVITGLDDDIAYNVRITRLCCDGTVSNFTQIDVTTTVTSPA